VIVAFDNNVLCLLLHPDAQVPNDPETSQPVTGPRERIEYLVETLRKASARILLPTPVIAEFLTFASSDYLDEINRSQHFEIAPFDQRAAIEAAETLKKAIADGLGKKAGTDGAWQKIKVDRQVVAIARVAGATSIYTTDAAVAILARQSGITPVHVAALPLPPSRTPLLDSTED
jgi:predicted nucleic acid-binding protein